MRVKRAHIAALYTKNAEYNRQRSSFCARERSLDRLLLENKAYMREHGTVFYFLCERPNGGCLRALIFAVIVVVMNAVCTKDRFLLSILRLRARIKDAS